MNTMQEFFAWIWEGIRHGAMSKPVAPSKRKRPHSGSKIQRDRKVGRKLARKKNRIASRSRAKNRS